MPQRAATHCDRVAIGSACERMRVRSWLLAVLAACVAPRPARSVNITIVHKTLEVGEEHSLLVDQSLEYVLQFVPTLQQRQYPLRVWFLSDGGDVTRPLLLTARQRTGAVTWQLPYSEGNELLFELQRTLCPDAAVAAAAADCVEEGQEAEEEAGRGGVTLHVSSSCARSVTLRLRADPATDWRLRDTLHFNATLARPHVSRFQFDEGEESVRLVVSSTDDVCATVAVHPLTCPIAQTFEAIAQTSLRMTVLRSGGMQLSKSRYPHGFYIVALVASSDAACTGEEEEEAAGEGTEGGDVRWLWQSVWQDAPPRTDHDVADTERRKQLHYQLKAALSRREYVLGGLATLALFLLFYVLFGALVLAERWPTWYNCVAPRARLKDHNNAEATAPPADVERRAAGAGTRTRRDSTATFDGSDASDTDSDAEDFGHPTITNVTTNTTPATTSPRTTSPANVTPGSASPVNALPDAANGRIAADLTEDAVNGAVRTEGESEGAVETSPRPFGLPGRLHVAALARHREHVLRARSQRYLYTLYTVAVFYALPVLQFVAAFQVMLNVSGSLDLCYYNFLCAHPAGALSDFNHVFSNLGYLLLGALYMLQLRRRKARRKRHPRDEEYGIPPHYGLSASLGAGLMVVALLSASYHVCPNALNFQFDTAFMYVLAVLSMVKIYQARHPDINARAHATFAVLAVLIALVVWGVLGGGPLFWSVFTVLHVFTFLLLSLRIYYVGQFRLEKASLATAAASLGARAAPLYLPRLLALLVANAVNWAFAIYGLINQSANIASHLLFVLLCNALLHMVFYLSMKLLHGERPRWYAWLYLAGAALAWAPALYYFTAGSTDWQATPAQSRLHNHECRLLRFYDSHDLWHMLSAIALYLTFNALLTWDDGLAAVKRTDIAVF